jgi:signal transduction histidine kinase
MAEKNESHDRHSSAKEYAMAFLCVQSIQSRSLRNVLYAAFALTFAIPLLIYFSIAVRFDILDEPDTKLSFAGILLFSLFGFILLRKMVDHIIGISREASNIERLGEEAASGEHNELKKIAETFHKLIARLEESTFNLGRRVAELASLKELTDICSHSADIHLLASDILEKLMSTTDAGSGIFLTTRNEGKSLILETVRGIDETFIPSREMETGSTLFGHSLGENRVLMGNDPRLIPGYNPETDHFFSGPYIVKAITARGKTIGILGLFRNDGARPFGSPELDYISTALCQIAFAFENAELIHELKESLNHLKAVQGKLLHLERVAAVHEIVVSLSDKINNPLTVIQGHAELLKRNPEGLGEKITQSVDSILESCARCAEIMHGLRLIQIPLMSDSHELL